MRADLSQRELTIPAMSGSALIQVAVGEIVQETSTVITLRPQRCDGHVLEPFAPESHVELYIPNGTRSTAAVMAAVRMATAAGNGLVPRFKTFIAAPAMTIRAAEPFEVEILSTSRVIGVRLSDALAFR
jgi:hypothetical protein